MIKDLEDLEFAVDDLFNDLKDEVEGKGLKKKHKLAITEFKYALNRIRSKLWPRIGLMNW